MVHISWDGTPHASKVNGLRLKVYHARLMLVQKDGELEEETNALMTVEALDGEGLKSLFAAADHK